MSNATGDDDGIPEGSDFGLPGGDSDDSGIDLEVIEDMSAEEFRAWVAENGPDLTPEELETVHQFAQGQAAHGPSDENLEWAQASGALEVMIEEGPEAGAEVISEQDAAVDEQAYQDAVDAGAEHVATVLASAPPGAAPDLSGIDQYMPEGLSVSGQQAYIDAARQAGEDEWATNRDAQLAGTVEDEAERAAIIAEERNQRNLIVDSGTPRWLLEFAGGELTDQQKDRFVDYWNDDHGTNFRSFDEITPMLESMGETAYTQNFTNAVLADQEPLITESIELPFTQGARRVNYTVEEMEALRAMGFSNDAITRLVRLSGIANGEGAITPGANGDTLPISAMAGLLRYYGGGEEFARYNQRQQEVAVFEQQMGLRPGQFAKMTIEERRDMLAEWEAGQRSAQAVRGEGEGTPFDARIDAWNRAENMLRSMGRSEEGTSVGVLLANNNYGRGVDMYNGDQVLAFIHAVDPQLAGRIASSGGDPEKLDGQDSAAAMNILDRGGLFNRGSTAFEQLGGQIGEHIFSQLSYFDTGGGGGGAGPQRRMLDPVSVKEQTQRLFSEFLLPVEPSDETVKALTNDLQAALDGSPEGMSFDVSARIMDWVRGRADYAELYGKKSVGSTEQEWRGQFEAGVQDLLGPQGDPDSVRTGMRTGNYQAALGSALGSGDALATNSRLRGRMAEAFQRLAEFT